MKMRLIIGSTGPKKLHLMLLVTTRPTPSPLLPLIHQPPYLLLQRSVLATMNPLLLEEPCPGRNRVTVPGGMVCVFIVLAPQVVGFKFVPYAVFAVLGFDF
jgi:hypothetical protein